MKRYTYGFVALGLLIMLAAPFWIVKLPGYSPKDKWLSTMAGAGNYHYFAKEIYDRKEDIDILVIGDSVIWCGLDTDMIQTELSKKLGRKAVVLGMAANWRGEDLLYLQVKEMLAHRRVKMLILDMPVLSSRDDPHQAAAYWWIMGEHADDFAKMDTRTFLKLYAVSALGAPRHLLNFVRENPVLDDQHDIRSSTRTGALKEAHGFGFTDFHPPKKIPRVTLKPEDVIFSEKSANHYAFTAKPLSQFQFFLLDRLFTMAAEHNVHVVATSVPRHSQARNKVAIEIADYSQLHPGFIDTATVVPDALYSTLTDDEIKDFYYDEHMNISGAEFYTKAFLPTIFALYDKQKGDL